MAIPKAAAGLVWNGRTWKTCGTQTGRWSSISVVISSFYKAERGWMTGLNQVNIGDCQWNLWP